jgi:hypothetical protein
MGLYWGITMPNQRPTLSHLLFIDDVVFISSWDEMSIHNLSRILRGFYLMSGLKVNLAKTGMFGVRGDESSFLSMSRILNRKKGSLSFRYFSLIMGANMNLVKH